MSLELYDCFICLFPHGFNFGFLLHQFGVHAFFFFFELSDFGAESLKLSFVGHDLVPVLVSLVGEYQLRFLFSLACLRIELFSKLFPRLLDFIADLLIFLR